MNVEERLDVLKQIGNVAALAGLKGGVDDQGRHFMMGFALDDGRRQAVYVRPAGENIGGQLVVTVFSPCLSVKKGLFAGFSKDKALELLKLNEQVLFARFGIWENDDEYMVVASVDHLMETLDPDELKSSAWHVAFAADNYERKYGGDDF
ncbi:MAG: hypothetical protein P1V51_24685 [Deltaproteobacteria bacterium]|nr:hypothetical protein [Deltaproteobacteria bacterium]